MSTAQVAIAGPQPSIYAGLGRRFGALCIDMALAFAIVLLCGFTFRFLRAFGLWTPSGVDPVVMWHALGIGPKALVLAGWVVSGGPLHSILLESSGWQATVGKRAIGIYVVGDQTSRISLLRALGRWFAKWFLGFFMGSIVSAVTVGASEKHQALHDMIAKTTVQNGKAPGALSGLRIAGAFVVPYLWLVFTFYTTL